MEPQAGTETYVHQARRAVYAGSFDPPTNGHLWVIEQGVMLFDELHVAVGTNPTKQAMFTLEEKLQMLRAITEPYPNVSVGHIGTDLLADYAHDRGFQFLLRGMRTPEDYAKEKEMNSGNRIIQPEVSSVYVMCPPNQENVSSSLVKGIVGCRRWEEIAAQFVPDFVLQALIKHHRSSDT